MRNDVAPLRCWSGFLEGNHWILNGGYGGSARLPFKVFGSFQNNVLSGQQIIGGSYIGQGEYSSTASELFHYVVCNSGHCGWMNPMPVYIRVNLAQGVATGQITAYELTPC